VFLRKYSSYKSRGDEGVLRRKTGGKCGLENSLLIGCSIISSYSPFLRRLLFALNLLVFSSCGAVRFVALLPRDGVARLKTAAARGCLFQNHSMIHISMWPGASSQYRIDFIKIKKLVDVIREKFGVKRLNCGVRRSPLRVIYMDLGLLFGVTDL
jgi:hypothetical protein